MRTLVASAVLLLGAAFMFVAGLGLARFPDLYTRMHAATKPATVGVVAVMSAVAVAFSSLPVTVRAGLVAVFFLLTAPIATHAIARSAHATRVPLARGTRVELEEGPPHGAPGDGASPGADRHSARSQALGRVSGNRQTTSLSRSPK